MKKQRDMLQTKEQDKFQKTNVNEIEINDLIESSIDSSR